MPIKLSTYLKNTYGEKIYRLSLSSGCCCPNRDGSIIMPGKGPLTKGCTFCSEGGSGEFTSSFVDIEVQIKEAKKLIAKKTDAESFIAYFQSFTNTYGDPKRLCDLYTKVTDRDDIRILSLGTRPDCLGDEIIDMLKELNSKKPVWVELGLQTIHEKTAQRVERGYDLPVFEDAYRRLKAAGLSVIVHVIFGLPGETKEEMLGTIRYLSALCPEIDGIKIHNLQILKGTRISHEYGKDLLKEPGDRDFYIMSMEEYTDLVAEALSLLPQNTVVHRMTGDGPRALLEAPLWSLDKKRVLNMLTKKTKGLLI